MRYLGFAILGLVLIAYTVMVRVSTARSVHEQGRPLVLWRYLAGSYNLWIGLSLVLQGFAPAAGIALFVLVLVVGMMLLCRDLVNLVTKKRRTPVD